MLRISFILILLLSLLGAVLVFSADQTRDRDRIQLSGHEMDQDRDRLRDPDRLDDGEYVYGSQLMSEQERREYREEMRTQKTQEDREQFRRLHHEKMQERARAMGKTLPENPPKGMQKGHRGYGDRGTAGGRGPK